WLAIPLVAYSLYVVSGPMTRLLFLYEVKRPVRLAAASAILLTVLLASLWPRVRGALAAGIWTPTAAAGLATILAAGDAVQFAQWAAGRTYRNYEASIAVGRALPAGTLVQGKLANGLALENRIRPIF